MNPTDHSTNGQSNIFEALGALDPTLMYTMEAEPGWVWARCPTCGEDRYVRRRDRDVKCSLTPACPGRLATVLDCLCVVCGKPVTRRRRDADVRFCSKKCEEAQ